MLFMNIITLATRAYKQLFNELTYSNRYNHVVEKKTVSHAHENQFLGKTT